MYHKLAMGLVAAALLAAPAPAIGQETTTTTDTVWSPTITVWVMVKDHDEDEGVHWVMVAVTWDKKDTPLAFGEKLDEGELVVFLPLKEDPEEKDLYEGCQFANSPMDHGESKLKLTKRMDENCTAPAAKSLPLLGIEYAGRKMVCNIAARTDGTDDPAVRYFGCNWTKPTG